jgi:hypothetical protein
VQSVCEVQLGFRQRPDEHVRPDLQFESDPQVPPQEFGVPGQEQLVSVLQSGFRQRPLEQTKPVLQLLSEPHVPPHSFVTDVVRVKLNLHAAAVWTVVSS